MAKIIKTVNMEHLSSEIQSGNVIGCGICKTSFEGDDDFSYAMNTGTCTYCHQTLKLIKVKE